MLHVVLTYNPLTNTNLMVCAYKSSQSVIYTPSRHSERETPQTIFLKLYRVTYVGYFVKYHVF